MSDALKEPATAHALRLRTGGNMPRLVRQVEAADTGVQRGEVVVPTQLGDDLYGVISCPSAPFVAGSLRRRGCRVRLAALARCGDSVANGDAHVYAATCPQLGGGTAAIAAAVAFDDKRVAAQAQAAVEEWAAVADTRMVLVAGRPWCSGALHASAASREAAAEHEDGATVWLYEPLALPPETVTELASLGAVPVTALANAQPGDVVVFPAHGVRPELRAEAAERGLKVVDATCPIVASAQEAAVRLADRGQHLVLIGPQSAASVGPIASSAAGHVTLVESASGTATMRASDAQRISYMVQPGFPLEAADSMVAALRSRYPAAKSTHPDGLCYAASDRANTVHAIATGSDLVLVLGDARSADTRQLAGRARDAGARVQLISAATELEPAMIAGATTIGTVESTSAAAGLVTEVVTAITGLGRVTVAHRQVTTEMADTAN